MNDNHAMSAARRAMRRGLEHRQSKLIEALSEIASRAVAKPESLTMGEIQEVGWGFLMAAKDMPRSLSTDR